MPSPAPLIFAFIADSTAGKKEENIPWAISVSKI